ncbi:DNA mismatch repair endonuclease MutL [Halonotius aquaticus]|uniref:DNA mismatch repair protein MutL n=1 Tax=Halonotius aquaticus TaxID=2216978 RepID=A0A3A6PYN8_9EURY|nr:DNA mismatch repair endonuclease MutL [Halonotius aquaticus]RJX41993.1 DNA mismatch repair endonuclease MutL [Halonotius aquaticus]
MPSQLTRLDDATVAKIAAGEVISRPARVVSELIDNALDAGASRIDIAVDGDGTERIRVEDDGHGLSRGDAELAVQRHTTSKLPADADASLTAVSTLGFRGEALAAICDCAIVEIVTNDGDAVGTELRAADGEVTVTDTARGQGTTVTVTDLFADRPARRESLASAAAEFSRISDLVADYALAHPDVGFSLRHDGTKTFSTPGGGLRDALLGVYDADIARNATVVERATDIDIEDGTGSFDLRGILTYPSVTRSTREHVRISVAGRPVSDSGLRQAVIDGYGSLLPGDQFPIAAVDIEPPTGAVDPNVHPAKQRVGLRYRDALEAAVEDAVSEALSTADARRAEAAATDLTTELDGVDRSDPFADLRVIGSFRELYLLCEDDDELLVIDQHAAHERVNYERLQAAVGDDAIPTATLEPAESVSVSPAAASLAEEYADLLAALGFDVEPFGGGTLRVSAVPAPFGRVADADTLRATLDELAAGESPADPRETLLATLACQPSLKAGAELSLEDAESLLARLGECEQPFACPHGRPTICSIDETTLAAGFDRGATRFE